MRTAIVVPEHKDQIQIVVGMESSLVANRVPSVFKANIEVPWAGLFVFASKTEVGGLAGCGART